MASPPAAPESRDVGVVIVTYEPTAITTAVIDAVMAAEPGAVVVVDNSAATPPLVADAAARHPGLMVLPQHRNLGFCAANNLGVQALPDCDYVLFLNPDAIVEPQFLTAAAARLAAAPDAGALGPKLVGIDAATLDRTDRLDCTGIAQRWYGRYFDRGQGEIDRGQYDDPTQPVTALCAAAMMCRRSALSAVSSDAGPFDEAFYMYKEDIDLSLRLVNAGWRLVYAPDLVVGHARGTPGRARRQLPEPARRRSVRNEWRIWHKGLQPWRVRAPMTLYLAVKTLIVWSGR